MSTEALRRELANLRVQLAAAEDECRELDRGARELIERWTSHDYVALDRSSREFAAELSAALKLKPAREFKVGFKVPLAELVGDRDQVALRVTGVERDGGEITVSLEEEDR